MSETGDIPFFFYKNELTSTIFIVRGSLLVATIQISGDKFAFMLSDIDSANDTAKLIEGLPMMTAETISEIVQHESVVPFFQKSASLLVELFYELSLTEDYAKKLAEKVDKEKTRPRNSSSKNFQSTNPLGNVTGTTVKVHPPLPRNNISSKIRLQSSIQKMEQATDTHIALLKLKSRAMGIEESKKNP